MGFTPEKAVQLTELDNKLAGVGDTRFINGILSAFTRTIAFRMTENRSRMEPAEAVLPGVTGFHYKGGRGSQIQMVHLAGEEPDWNSKTLDSVAWKLMVLDMQNRRKALPLPQLLGQEQLRLLEKFVVYYRQGISEALKKNDVEDTWLSGLDEDFGQMKHKVLGKLVGNTGDAGKLTMVVEGSFSVRRGEFVRIMHQDRQDEPVVAVLGRINKIHRSNMLFNAGFGDSVTELELLPGANVTGENLFANVELVGYRDPVSRQIKIPRRPLDPGARVETVDYQFLCDFYEFNEHTSLHLGNLVGYERGENTVPVFLDVNTLVTEHMAILAMTGSGKSYTCWSDY